MPPIRVAHIPGAHPYARHLSSAHGTGTGSAHGAEVVSPSVEIVPDVIPFDRPAGTWWPPVMFGPDWIRDNAQSFDVMHVHFGFESFDVDHLDGTLRALSEVRRPLVFTVHDLQNPQLTDQTAHDRALDVLVPGADRLTTLTDGAAREISARWSREVTVIPHPHVLEFDNRAVDDVADPTGNDTAVVAMHLKDLRPNIDAVRATRTLVDAVSRLRARGTDVTAEVHLSDRVRDEAMRLEVVAICADSAAVTLVEHPRLSDDGLARSLASADACVLPYRHGTHSGWLELCFDLGVPVVAPAIGHYVDQARDGDQLAPFEPGSAESLAGALDGILRARAGALPRSVVRAERREVRRRDRELIAARHLALYREAIAAMPGATPDDAHGVDARAGAGTR